MRGSKRQRKKLARGTRRWRRKNALRLIEWRVQIDGIPLGVFCHVGLATSRRFTPAVLSGVTSIVYPEQPSGKETP